MHPDLFQRFQVSGCEKTAQNMYTYRGLCATICVHTVNCANCPLATCAQYSFVNNMVCLVLNLKLAMI